VTTAPNKGRKLTNPEHIGASQLFRCVMRTAEVPRGKGRLDMRMTLAGGIGIAIWALLAVRDADGVLAICWVVVMGVLGTAWVASPRHGGRIHRAVLAFSILGAATVLGLVGGPLGAAVHFYANRASYSAAAEDFLKARKHSGEYSDTVGVADRRDSSFVFIYDPRHLGRKAWRRHSEMSGSCNWVSAEWVHCPIS